MDSATGLLVFLIVYLFFILLLGYTVVFGGSRRDSNGLIARANGFLTETLPDSCQGLIGRVFCGGSDDPAARASDAFETAMGVFEARVMPLIYLGLLAAGLTAAKSQILPRLPDLNPRGVACPPTRFACWETPLGGVSVPPRTGDATLYMYAVAAFGAWLSVYLADPGYVTGETLERLRDAYDYDEILFVSGGECRTCKRVKLPRSKHDRLVGRCVMRYDHFCGWTGNAIGMFNTNRFVTFLAVHLVMLIHGALLCAEIVRARMLVFIAGNYTYTPANWKITRFSPVVAVAAEPMVCLFFFVLIVSVGVVGGFLTYHAYLIARNTTTSETFKWSPIVSDCLSYHGENDHSLGDKLREDAEKRARETGEDMEYVPPFLENGQPVNIYDRGVLKNFHEVLFPARYLRMRTAIAQRKLPSRAVPGVAQAIRSSKRD